MEGGTFVGNEGWHRDTMRVTTDTAQSPRRGRDDQGQAGARLEDNGAGTRDYNTASYFDPPQWISCVFFKVPVAAVDHAIHSFLLNFFALLFLLRCVNSMMGRILEAMQNIRTRVDMVDVLILENNNIPHLPSRAFGSVKVNRLFIENNRIQTIDRNAFAGVESYLTEIYIKEPSLNVLPHDAINYLRSLSVFSIDSSQVQEMPTVNGLQKLKLLKIDKSNITSIPPNSLKNLPGLRYLHVTNSRLQRLEVGVLENLPYLVLANFTGNQISWLHPRAFRYMEQMQELVLADNEIRDADMVGQAVKVIKTIQKLDVSNNKIEKLRDGSFLDIISLQEMTLANNRLTLMQRAAFHRLPRLKKIDLSNNRIRNFHSEVFSDTPVVEELILRNNQISKVGNLTQTTFTKTDLLFQGHRRQFHD